MTDLAIKCRAYKNGSARFFTVDKDGAERLVADAYGVENTLLLVAALSAEIEPPRGAAGDGGEET